ncbi:uncharacterized protein HD556DRAFT_1227041 [Suillus plorans]|uniref:Fe2OG dioxygenase domain-containing protein n=1 Tax=Suillus plorans TaxID=116603 RepID=A0A9P7DUZ0_9AGAM|nr:uncharacterized protein HD556DRAFT_1227041 [Suillus plorans]KAG1803594.1 hypothetical protein HD556DRAFT_1227041 [Suillus plorans]
MDIYDLSSAAYKKARRQYLKTTKNRNEDLDAEWTPFRAAEKKYKARFPPPDLSHVLDLTSVTYDAETLASDRGFYCNGVEIRLLETNESTSSGVGKAFTVPRVPGLVILPSFVSPQDQRRLVRWALRDHARHPNETNLDAHYILPEEGLWNAHLSSDAPLVRTRACTPELSNTKSGNSGPRQLVSNTPADPANFQSMLHSPKPLPAPSPTVSPASPTTLISKLRWANIGWSYHWGSKQYDFTKGKGHVDNEIGAICKRAVSSVDWKKVFGQSDEEGWSDEHWRSWHETYEPDAGIVNYYQIKDTLMAHVDRSEVCATSPLVSISLGNAAIFLIGGLTRDVEPTAILLRSGDVVIMSGPACRRAYHGVPRILEDTLPEHFSLKLDGEGLSSWTSYELYMRTTRININVRQVFPKGFDPGLQVEN